jgi:hypothetical protein
MFKVLKVDGPNFVTDRGCVSLTPSQYADGGKSEPVSDGDWLRMRALFVNAPALLAACKLLLAAIDSASLERAAVAARDAVRKAEDAKDGRNPTWKP